VTSLQYQLYIQRSAAESQKQEGTRWAPGPFCACAIVAEDTAIMSWRLEEGRLCWMVSGHIYSGPFLAN
jgi:hypothetical protein